MSESIEHMNLVKDIVEYVKEKLPECVHGLIEIDDCIAQKPPKINGFIPDVYFNWKEQLIIGEAKTLADFERKHSREQFMTYLEACRLFPGTAMLIVAVPWPLKMTAKNYFRRVKQKFNGEIVILTDTLGSVDVWEI